MRMIFEAAGLAITVETCPHYLLFTEADMERHGPFAMIKPPLRTSDDHVALWDGVIDSQRWSGLPLVAAHDLAALPGLVERALR